MILNRGQALEMNVGYAVAVRTTLFIEALLDLYVDSVPVDSSAADAVRQHVRAYRGLADDLANWLDLTGDPHDLRPILIDQVYRMRDALNPSAVDELQHYGALEPAVEELLRQRLATLSLLTAEIARSVQQLPPLAK